MYNRKESMAGVCKRECLGHSQGDETLTLTRCYSSGLSQLYENIRGGSLSVECLFCIFVALLLYLLSWHDV